VAFNVSLLGKKIECMQDLALKSMNGEYLDHDKNNDTHLPNVCLSHPGDRLLYSMPYTIR